MALPVIEESACGQTDPKWHHSSSNDTLSPQSSGNEPSSRSSAPEEEEEEEEEDQCRIEQESDEYEGCVADEWQDTSTCPAPNSGGVITGGNLPPTEACNSGSKFLQNASQSDSLARKSKIKQHSGEESDIGALGSSGDPLHDVLVWMDLANVDEQSLCAEAGVAGPSYNNGVVMIHEGECYPLAVEEPIQLSPKVPSDEDARPWPPPHATHVSLMPFGALGTPATATLNSRSQELLRVMPLPPAASLSKQDAQLSRCSPRAAADEVVVDREEEEWLARKKLTGAIGRLVFYRNGQKPIDDILGLSRTRSGRLKVTALRPAGMASLAGVEVGDQLISINGQKPDESLLAEAVRMRLGAPATLIFMGFAGKLQAEVRVRQPDEPRCGLPAFTDVATTALNHGMDRNAQIELCDTVVFQQATASLLLEVAPLPESGETRGPDAGEPPLLSTIASATTVRTATVIDDRADMPAEIAEEMLGADSPQKQQQQQQQQAEGSCGQNVDEPMPSVLAPRALSRVYELQREDARRLVKRALRANTGVS